MSVSVQQQTIIRTQRYIKQLNEYDCTTHNLLTQHLPALTTYKRTLPDGTQLHLTLQYIDAGKLSQAVQTQIFELTKLNMYQLYNACKDGKLWHWNDKRKSKQLFDPRAKYILIHNTSNGDLAGFVHLRYDSDELDHSIPILYLYEIQLYPAYTHRGIGAYCMGVCELLMHKLNLYKVCLTVLKHNTDAIKFYKKLKYTLDDTDPSTGDTGDVYEYEILSKTNSRYVSSG